MVVVVVVVKLKGKRLKEHQTRPLASTFISTKSVHGKDEGGRRGDESRHERQTKK